MDYLAALLHARRSRMAEGEQLDVLCRSKGLPDLFHAIFPNSEVGGALDFQRLLVQELINELSGFRDHMSGPGVDLLNWTLIRFQVENLKILIRASLKRAPIEEIYGHLISLPKELVLNTKGLAAAESPEDFVRLVPKGFLRDNLEKALEVYHDHPRPFFFEAALDHGYFHGLVDRVEKLSREDREIIKPMVSQEVDIFHLMMAARGKFHYNLTPDMLLPMHIEGTRITHALFAAMLNDVDFHASMGRVAERVLDVMLFKQGSSDGSMTVDAPMVESLAWKRFFRLSNLAFRKGNIGLGAIMGYSGLRRVEVANLIAISEGIINRMTAETIRGRLIPRSLFADRAM
jgi:vacuolar-type H+-ATPase subunit C/Vma6